MDVEKAQRDPSSTFFGTMKLFKILIFLISHFSRFSRKFLKGPSPVNFFDISQQIECFKKSQRVTHFSTPRVRATGPRRASSSPVRIFTMGANT